MHVYGLMTGTDVCWDFTFALESLLYISKFFVCLWIKTSKKKVHIHTNIYRYSFMIRKTVICYSKLLQNNDNMTEDRKQKEHAH